MKLRKTWISLIVVLVLLFILRLFLPSILKWYVNRTLDKIPGYKGHIEDIDVHLWRGAYEIQGLDLRKIEGKVPVPFFHTDSADFSVQWREIFHGSLVGQIKMKNPELNFVAGPSKEQSQLSVDSSWQDRVEELFPLQINFLGVSNGAIHFKNPGARPPVDVYLGKIYLSAHNLTNSRKSYDRLLARVEAKGQPMDQGSFDFQLSFNPFEKQPAFDLNTTLTDLNLVSINSFVRHYGGVVADKGGISFYIEAAAKDGAFNGYVKPFIKDVKFKSLGAEDLKLTEKLKGWVANIIAWIFTNRKEDSISTKVEFAGKLDDPKVKTWAAVRAVFRHAFIQAISPQLDNTIRLDKVKP